MKKLNMTFLLTMLLSMVGARAFAYDAQIGGIYYNFSEAGATVTHYSNDYYNNQNAYSGNVVIPESVTYNGKTYSVTGIDNYAFNGCYSVTSLTIPNSIETIGHFAFQSCSGLTSVIIPNSVTNIHSYAFRGCSGLTSVTIPNSVTTIESFTFLECSNLTSVSIPNSVTSIGNRAFDSCSNLTSVTIPNSVTSIGGSAFNNCTKLTNITFPNSLTDIGSKAFDGTAWYNNQPDGLVYAGKVAYKYKGTMPTNTNIVLQDGILGIAGSAFLGCSGLASITIPNSVTSIGSSVFYRCTSLTSVTIPNSVTSINDNAFNGCSGLTSVSIPNSVTSIGNRAFDSCSNLTNVTIPNSVTSIGSMAFYDCSGLTSVTIPNSVTSIGNSAFSGCPNLIVKLTISDFSTFFNFINNNDIADRISFASIMLVDENDNEIKNFIIPEDVTSVGNTGSAFWGCSGLRSVTIPKSVTTIGNSAFNGCSGLMSITLPNSVTTIGDRAFSGCSGLTSVTCYANNPPTLGGNAFSDYTIPLYVPKGSVIKYKAAENWRNFVIIREISEEQDVYLSVRQVNGMVRMKVDAEKPYFNLQIKADEGWMIHSVTLNENDVTAEVSEDGNYTTPVISSDATLNVVFEKANSAIVSQSASQLRVNAYGNTIHIQGAKNGEKIAIYTADGKLVECKTANLGTTTITLPENQTYIVKGKNKTVKVRL